jgi:hypothetical protein
MAGFTYSSNYLERKKSAVCITSSEKQLQFDLLTVKDKSISLYL